jgi:hypothetical protein
MSKCTGAAPPDLTASTTMFTLRPDAFSTSPFTALMYRRKLHLKAKVESGSSHVAFKR